MNWEDTKRRVTVTNFRREGVAAFHIRGGARTACRVILGRYSDQALDGMHSKRASASRTVSVQRSEVGDLRDDDQFEADAQVLTVDAVIENDGRVMKALVL